MLSLEKARQIRESAEPARELAARFGVSLRAIWAVRSNRVWQEEVKA